jgi:putative endonuclease
MAKGYRMLAMRYKTPVGEIDLVMRRGRVLVMVEVKARANYAAAAAAIHMRNQSRVMRAAQYFLIGHPAYANDTVRFDAVLIAWYKWPRHVPHAFSEF